MFIKKLFQYFVLYLANLDPKFPKSTKRTPTKIFLKNNQIGIKNNKILCWFQICQQNHHKNHAKNHEQNSLLKVHFSAFTHTVFWFIVCNFFMANFFAVSYWFCAQLKIQFFLIPILIFFKKFFFGILFVVFGSYGPKRRSYGATYWKMLFTNRS